MKISIIFALGFLLFLAVSAAEAQVTIIMSMDDIEIGWDLENWARPEVLSITYSPEPLRPERKIGKPGKQEWEALMCDSKAAAPRKAIMVFMCP